MVARRVITRNSPGIRDAEDVDYKPTTPTDWPIVPSDAAQGLDVVRSIDADRALTGWPLIPGVTFSFDNGTRTFTVTDGGSAYYYINDVVYTLNGNHTVVIDDIEGLWYIYFSGDTLTASQTLWVITDNDKAMVSMLYWDATNNKEIILTHEPHGYAMPASTHARLHFGGGTAWEQGLLVSDAGGELVNVSAGIILDEDLAIAITDGAGAALFEQVLSPAELPIYYRDGATAWRILETTDKANATDVGYTNGGDLKWNEIVGGNYQLTNVTAARHIAMFVVASNDLTEPVAMIMGQREDVLLTAADTNNIFAGLDLTGLPFEELVILGRVIIKESGAGVFYTIELITDLRAFNAQGNVTTPLITDHDGLANRDLDSNHPQYLLLDGTRLATQLNVDNLRLDGNAITSTDANGDITITPNGTGDLILDGLKWPQVDGNNLGLLTTDGGSQLSWINSSGTGNVVRVTGASMVSPTIVTPMIASFVNATHTHTAAGASGGLLATKLRTVTKIVYIENPTASDSFPITFIPDNITMVRVHAVTDADTVDFNIERRNTNTPDQAGTDVLTADLTADDGGEATTTFDNAGAVVAEEWLTYVATSITGTPANLWVALEYTID